MRPLDDDMDELFRNAASQYPLNTGGADWNAIKSRLDQQGEQQAVAVNRAAGGKWLRWLWLPLLVFLFFIAHQPRLDVGYVPPKDGVLTQQVYERNMGDPVSNGKAAIDKGIKAGIEKPLPERVIIKEIVVNRYPVMHLATLPVKLFPAGAGHTWQQNMMQPVNTGRPAVVNDSLIQETEPLQVDNKPVDAAVPLLTARSATDSVVTQAAPMSDTTLATTEAPGKVKKNVKVQKGFYGGIIAGPDVSSVKLQQVKNVGYNAGLVAGYRISERIAVETGVLWNRKYYYSEGRYFNTKKIPMPANVKILDVDGWCNMIEIPVQARYFFNMKEKSSWYVSAGLSSYIMSKEKYDYKYEYYNNVDSRTWEYNTSTRNWFSIIHAGIGYERRIGVWGTLRLEPYLKIPVGGVGIGSMPLSSVGLNIGITRPLRW